MLCLPLWDLPTRSSSGFLLRYTLPRMGPRFLMGPMARNPLFNMLVNGSDIMVGTGHGSEEEYSGFHDAQLWKIGQYNPAQVKGKVVKLISCDCGAKLIPDLVNNGSLCAMGFDDDLLWVADPHYYFTPWADKDAALCMLPIIDGLNVLLDGGKCSEAFAAEQAGFLKNAADTDFELERTLLEYNHAHAVLYGDPNATISPRPNIIPSFPPPPLIF